MIDKGKLMIILMLVVLCLTAFAGCGSRQPWTFEWDFEINEGMKRAPGFLEEKYYKVTDEKPISLSKASDDYVVNIYTKDLSKKITYEVEEYAVERGKSWEFQGVLFVRDNDDYSRYGFDKGVWVAETEINKDTAILNAIKIVVEPREK